MPADLALPPETQVIREATGPRLFPLFKYCTVGMVWASARSPALDAGGTVEYARRHATNSDAPSLGVGDYLRAFREGQPGGGKQFFDLYSTQNITRWIAAEGFLP